MMQEQHSSSGIEFKPQTQSQTLAMFAPPVSTSVVQVQVIPNFASPQINQQSVSTVNTNPEITVNSNNQFAIQAPTFQQSILSQQQTASFISNSNQPSVSVVAISPVNIQQTNIQQNTNIREEQTKYEVRLS